MLYFYEDYSVNNHPAILLHVLYLERSVFIMEI